MIPLSISTVGTAVIAVRLLQRMIITYEAVVEVNSAITLAFSPPSRFEAEVCAGADIVAQSS